MPKSTFSSLLPALSLLFAGPALAVPAATPPAARPVAVPGGDRAAVSPDGVFAIDGLPPRVIWTWTTADQIEVLRAEKRLLIRSESPVYGQTAFAREVAAWAAEGDAVAAVLARPELARHRYGWVQPWATAVSPRHEVWGDQLLRIELRPEAIVAVLDAAGPQRWRFVDLDGRPVVTEVALARPERIAMVIHHHPPVGEVTWWSTFESATLAFRELVVVNEGMVACWEYGTPAVRAELERSIAALRQLAAELPEAFDGDVGDWNHELARTGWRVPAEALSLSLSEPRQRWEAALSVAHWGTLPTRGSAERIAALLSERLVQGPPLAVCPGP